MLCHKSVEEILHTFKKETKNLNFSVWDGKRGCLTHIAPRRRVPELPVIEIMLIFQKSA